MAFALAAAASGCVEDTEDRTVAEAALDEASITAQVQTLTASFIEMAATAPSGASPQARAEALTSVVSKLLDCGTTATATCAGSETCCGAHGGTGCDDQACQALVCAAHPDCCETEWSDICATKGLDVCDGTVVWIAMAEAGCSVRGREMWGTVTIDVGGEPESATVDWIDVTDGGVTVLGTTTASWAAGDERQITDTGTLTINSETEGPFRFHDTRTQTPTATGVRVEAGARCAALDADDVDCWTEQGAAACEQLEVDCATVESLATELTWTEPTPLEGGHQVTLRSDGWNRQVGLAYTHHDESSVQVSAEVRGIGHTLPRSTFQFEVHFP
jgi:hypothetical protein